MLNEPVRDVRDVEFSLFLKNQISVGTARPPSVGAIIRIPPHLVVAVSFVQADFKRVWALARAGQLKYAYLAFTPPRYRSALVVNVSFFEREGGVVPGQPGC